MSEANDPRVLVEELLYNAKASGNRILERRLADLSVWFYQNRGRIAPENLKTRVDFLEKAFWILIEVCALQTERVHELEASRKGKALWLPKGMAVKGDIQRLEVDA